MVKCLLFFILQNIDKYIIYYYQMYLYLIYNLIVINNLKKILEWGLGIGDWGLGIGDWEIGRAHV